MIANMILAAAVAAAGADVQEVLARLRAKTDARIAEIRATPNLKLPAGARTYYISEKRGDDAADGLTPATAWKTTAKLTKDFPEKGAYVLLERGGVYRGGFAAAPGVTYTAWGEGPKPCVCSSPENGADPAKWTETEVKGVWAYQLGKLDVGTVVFDEGERHAIKICPVYNEDGTYTQQYNKEPFDHGYADLKGDLHFWHDYSEKTDFKPFAKGTGILYLKSDENPGRRFRSVEFNVRKHGIAVGGSCDVTVDNLTIKYVGSHGIGAGTVSGLKVTNCEFAWIGGSIQAERIFNRRWAVRFGNAIEIYGGCDDYTVENCYIRQVYDAGITQQVGLNKGDKVLDQKKMRYARNVIENCNYSIEYFLSGVKPENPSRMEDFVIEDNIMWDAGVGFCEQRPDRSQGAHIKSWRNNCNRATGYVIRRNWFARSAEMLVEISANLENPDGSGSMPRLEKNVFVGAEGQRFGVLNQGKAQELKYDSSLDERFPGNHFLFN